MISQFKKQIWILNQLLESGGLTYLELKERWEHCSLNVKNTTLTKRTFENDRRAIEDIFDIKIICDASRGYMYRIERNENIINDRIKTWLLSVNSNKLA